MAFLLAGGCASDLARAAASAQEWVAPAEDPQAAVTLTADRGASQRVGELQRWLLEGRVQIVQALQTIAADRAVVWIDPGDDQRPTRLVVYVEGSVHVQWQRAGPLSMIEPAAPQPPPDRLVDEVWLGRLFTWREPIVRVTAPAAAELSADELIARGEAARTAGLPASVAAVGFQQSETPQMVSPQTGWAQPTIPQAGPPGGLPLGGPIPGAIPAATRIEILPRQSTVPLNLKTLPGSTPNERVLVASGGVRLVIDSSALAALPAPTGDAAQRVIVLADNVVAWSNALDPSNPAPDQARWEVYLEGNVVFSSGERTIYASRMYYDATYRRGTLMHAHFYTPVDRTPGLVRLKADVLQQVDANRYQAMGAAFTSSRIGFPRYWLQSDQLEVDALPSGLPGSPLPDPYGADLGGSPARGEVYTARSFGNRVYWGGMPIFYWPRIETRLDEPSFYLRSIRVGNDDIFGFQVRTRWDLYQLLGRRPPGRRSEWLGAVDWLSDRGLGFGTEAEYELDALFGFAGDIRGRYQSWFIHDGGVDNLGRDRRAVPLEEDWRGRIVWNHRHRFRPGLKLDAEVGYLSDRNFLEQYFQQEWDTGKDLTSGLHVERLEANRSLNVWAEVQLNEFFTQTSWLPRADYFMLGQNVWGSRLVYHGHSHVGYGQFDPAEAPTNPVDLAKFDPLAWETASAQGIRAGTRHELDLPLQFGAVRVVPYLLVDGTYWQEDLDGSELSRIYGQTGVRASLPFWRADPTICSSLFNVNGLAHKVTLDAEFGYADASRDWDRLPLYDPLDDDAQEFFRRRFAFETYGIVAGLDVPLRFDERDLRGVTRCSRTSPRPRRRSPTTCCFSARAFARGGRPSAGCRDGKTSSIGSRSTWMRRFFRTPIETTTGRPSA